MRLRLLVICTPKSSLACGCFHSRPIGSHVPMQSALFSQFVPASRATVLGATLMQPASIAKRIARENLMSPNALFSGAGPQ